MLDLAPLFAIERTHLDELSDETGIMQHAAGSRPDPAHGYCTDDVARALTVDLLHADGLGWAAVAPSAGRSIAFLEAAFEPDCGRFRNFQSAGGRWLETVGLRGCPCSGPARAGRGRDQAGDARLRAAATTLFERALPASLSLEFLRPVAAAVIAAEVAARHGNRTAAADVARAGPDALAGDRRGSRQSRRLAVAARPILTYENGIVPRP